MEKSPVSLLQNSVLDAIMHYVSIDGSKRGVRPSLLY